MLHKHGSFFAEPLKSRQIRSEPTVAGFDKLGSLNCPCDRTGSAQFHFLASVFDVLIAFRNHSPVDQIRQLRSEGLSLAEVAKRSGTTVAVVRRGCGNLDTAAQVVPPNPPGENHSPHERP